MGENIRLAFEEIGAHKLRSFLTMLGVIIGIASIIAIVSTIKGTNEQIVQNLIGAGNNNVTISLRQGEGEYYMEMGIPAGVSQLTDRQKEEILELPDVVNATFYNGRTYADSITAGINNLGGGSVYGVDDRYLSTCGYSVYAGRGFIEDDFKTAHKVVLLDESAVGTLFPSGNAIGSTIEIRREPFIVVGLIRRDKGSSPVINSFSDYINYHQANYGMVLMPSTCWPIVYMFDEPLNCVIQASSTNAMSSMGRKAEELMNRSVSASSGDISYKAEDLLEKARNQQELSASTNNMLIWIASIALFVGGIGVMNIMLVSVTERTAEIGLKKALGARKSRIMLQFLAEAAVLTSLGGIIGVLAGIGLSQVISKMSDIPVAVSVPASVLAVAFSMLIGLVFGILPSYRAANMDPIEALRRE
jgi:putative ABC transport system permease protein